MRTGVRVLCACNTSIWNTCTCIKHTHVVRLHVQVMHRHVHAIRFRVQEYV